MTRSSEDMEMGRGADIDMGEDMDVGEDLDLGRGELELECKSLLRELAGPDVDPFFTARVLDALPEPLRFTGLSPRARATWIVGVHALGLGFAYTLLAQWEPAWASVGADAAHDLVGPIGDELSMMLCAAAVVVVACVAFVSSRSHTRPT